MVLSENVIPYLTEPDNIYDLAGNCFGLLSERVKQPHLFISLYLSEGKEGSSNPNLELLNRFSETIMWKTSAFQPSGYV